MMEPDQRTLDLVRHGGHVIVTPKDTPEVQVTIYRTGPAYGVWFFRVAGTSIAAEHCVPREYAEDGRFRSSVHEASYELPEDIWRKDPEILAGLVGLKIARKVMPLLDLPPGAAPERRPVMTLVRGNV